MKINWFSPLLPSRTAAADYSALVLPALGKHADVVAWTDQAEWESSLEKSVPVRCYTTHQVPWVDLNRGDVSIFNIGKEALFHYSPWFVSQRHPGIVILHDTALQNLFLPLYKERLRDRNAYCDRMAFYYGQEGREYAAAVWDGRITPDETDRRFPLTPLALEGARGVIVRTPRAFRELKGENRWPVCCLSDPEPFLHRTKVWRGMPDQHRASMDWAKLIVRFAEEVRSFHPAAAEYLTVRCAAEMSVWSQTPVLQTAMNKLGQEIMKLS